MTAAVLRYPPGPIVADYVRGGVGLALTLAPLAALDVHPALFWVLAAMAALFAVFLFRTAERHAARVTFDDVALTVAGPRPRRIAWAEIADLRIAYYSTRRDRQQGWMQMTVRSADGAAASIESSLDGFERLAARAADAARARGLPLAETTLENLAAIGIVYAPFPDREEAAPR